MNIQTAIPTPANGQAENKTGAVRRSENDNGGFETALRNKTDKGSEENAVSEKTSKTDGLLSGERAASALPKSIDGAVSGRLSNQNQPQDPDAAVDPQDRDAVADTPTLDQPEHADIATRSVQRYEHAPISAIQNWANRLRAIDGRSEADPVKPAANEVAAKVLPDGPSEVPGNPDLKTRATIGQSQTDGTIEVPMAYAAAAGKKVTDNPGRLTSEAPVPPPATTAKPHGRTGPQIETGEAPRQSAIERIAGNANQTEDVRGTEPRASSLVDRMVTTQKTDAAAATSLPAGQASVSIQNSASPIPIPAAPVTVTPDGNVKTNPATGSLLNQLEQVEVVREMAASDRFGFVSRLSQNGGSVQVLRLQLKPAELGTVTAHMRMENGQMTVELVAERDAAFRQLSKDLSVMQTAMRSMGIIVDEIVVSQGSAGGDTQQANYGQQRGASENRSESGFGRRPGQQSNDGDTSHEPGRNNSSNGDNNTASGIYI